MFVAIARGFMSANCDNAGPAHLNAMSSAIHTSQRRDRTTHTTDRSLAQQGAPWPSRTWGGLAVRAAVASMPGSSGRGERTACRLLLLALARRCATRSPRGNTFTNDAIWLPGGGANTARGKEGIDRSHISLSTLGGLPFKMVEDGRQY